MSDNLAPPILRYFAWSHLPPHLAEISEPFADLAQMVAAAPTPEKDESAPAWMDAMVTDSWRDDRPAPIRAFTPEMDRAFERIRSTLGSEPTHDSAAADEWNTAIYKIQMFSSAWELGEHYTSYCLRLLLEAKDCAVRSRVPPPSGTACATGASEQQTQEPARPTRTVVVYGEKGSKFPHVVTLKENMDDPAQREMLVFDMEDPVLLEEFEADCWGHAQTYVQAKYHKTLYRSPDPIVWEPWSTMLSQESS